MKVRIESHKDEVLKALEQAKLEALDKIGAKCAGYAALLAPVDTGRLKNSITWATQSTEGRAHSYQDDSGTPYADQVRRGVPKDSVAIGTNVEYAIYQEMGVGGSPAAHPYLTPAVLDHIAEYKSIAQEVLGGDV